MKIKVGVVGVGNLGRSLIENIKKNSNFNLVATFSRRKLKGTIPISKIYEYKDKIDLLFLSVGSQNNLEKVSNELIKHFNIIESYDNHTRLSKHISKLDILAKENNKIALCSFGWDPGLFSLMRGLFTSIGYAPHTFWGKGTSQGHSHAIKQIKGVNDAIQFTIPNKKQIKKIKKGKQTKSNSNHRRMCYVVCKKSDKKSIKQKIINMPNYFKGYNTKVHFIQQAKLDKIKNYSHKGIVLTNNNTINFSLNLESNPDFTSKILIAYAKSFNRLKDEKKYGAYTIFDIPLTYIIENRFKFL